MKEMVMKKILLIVVSLFTLLMFTGVALCAGAAAPVEKKAPAKVSTAKKQHLKKDELTKGVYVSVLGGAAFLTDSDVIDGNNLKGVDTDFGYAVAVAAGKRIGLLDKRVRVECELGYQKNNVDDQNARRELTGDIKAYTLLVNGYFDFVKGKKIVPYLTAGVGVAKVDADINNFTHEDDTAGAYQVGAGLAYHITDNWHIDLKYRYIDTFKDLGGENSNPEFTSNNVFLGVRYRF